MFTAESKPMDTIKPKSLFLGEPCKSVNVSNWKWGKQWGQTSSKVRIRNKKRELTTIITELYRTIKKARSNQQIPTIERKRFHTQVHPECLRLTPTETYHIKDCIFTITTHKR